MKVQNYNKLVGSAVALVLAVAPVALHSQSVPIAVKPGLWDMQRSVTRATPLPPEAEARIAALPAAQQAQVRAMMGGSDKPTVSTQQVCIAPEASMDGLLNQSQQSSGGMQCSFTNRVETARSASYDISCTGPTGTAKGHTDFRVIDDEHMSITSHTTVTANAHGTTSTSTVDATNSGTYVKADCGDVKSPGTPPAK